MQIPNEKEPAGQREPQNVQLEEKGAPGNVMEQSPGLKEMRSLKKTLVLKGRKGVVSWGMTPAAKLPTGEKELKKGLSSEGNQNQKLLIKT